MQTQRRSDDRMVVAIPISNGKYVCSTVSLSQLNFVSRIAVHLDIVTCDPVGMRKKHHTSQRAPFWQNDDNFADQKCVAACLPVDAGGLLVIRWKGIRIETYFACLAGSRTI